MVRILCRAGSHLIAVDYAGTIRRRFGLAASPLGRYHAGHDPSDVAVHRGGAGWLNRQQQDMLGYLREENKVLREQLKGKRIRFTDDQRRRLAAKGKPLGRKLLGEVCTLVTPETVLRWFRTLVGRKYDGSANRRPGRPRVAESIESLVVRMAKENGSWGYGRIQGSLDNLGHSVSRSTIARILKDHGLEPAPERRKGMSWKMFLKSHWSVLAATDLFTVELMTLRGLIRYHVLFVDRVEHTTSRDRGHCPGAGRALDEPGCPESDGPL